MSLKYAIRRNLFALYAHIKYPLPLWRFFNRKSAAHFLKQSPELNSVQKRIVADLNQTGIAVTSLEELFEDPSLLAKLQKEAADYKESRSVNHKKKFLIDYWDEKIELEEENSFLVKALSPKILDVVNTYLGMWSSLLYFTLQETVIGEKTLTNSQNWHRDPQEQKIVKVFCYLSDVDEDSGPFTYVKNSAPTQKHSYAKLFPQEIPFGSYPDKEKVEQAIKKEDVTPMLGKAGTVIFCDTNGLHYGGVSKKNSRLMSTFGYSAHTYRENQLYHYNDSFEQFISTLPAQSVHAIRKKWKDVS